MKNKMNIPILQSKFFCKKKKFFYVNSDSKRSSGETKPLEKVDSTNKVLTLKKVKK